MTTRIPGERVVAGLSCGAVLDRLSDYLDGDLEDDVRRALEEHLRGCDACARFGGEFRATIRALQSHLARPAPLPQGFSDRLARALDRDE